MTDIAATLIWLLMVVDFAAAQISTAPPLRDIPVPKASPVFGASSGNDVLRHRGPTGSPCLEVGGFARPHTTVSNLYDHVVAVKNNCPQRISIQVCYYHTQDCLPVEIPGGERKEAILGTMPSTRDFRFEFREKF
jgi:hypothetical protein